VDWTNGLLAKKRINNHKSQQSTFERKCSPHPIILVKTIECDRRRIKQQYLRI